MREAGMPDAGFAIPMAASLATRLCHDLAGPLVAVLASLELALEASPRGGGAGEPLQVGHESARHLAARLGLLRAAWGMEPEPVDAVAIAALADGLANRARLALDLEGMGGEPVSGAVGRIVLNMLLLAAESLPRGGEIVLVRHGGEIAARIVGPSAAWPAGLNGILLAPEAAEPTPRAVLPILLGLLARQCDARLALAMPSGLVGATPAPLLLTQS